MRSVRITLGLAVLLCAFGTVAAPALAKKKGKPPVVFGKFIASFPNGKPITSETPAATKGDGELSLNVAEGLLDIEECENGKTAGKVDSESSEVFFQELAFKHCVDHTHLGGKNSKLTGVFKVKNFKLAMEFRSNKSVELGEGAEDELEITKPSTVVIKTKGIPCSVTIPRQVLPAKETGKPEKEYGVAGYETEVFPAKMKTFPLGVQDKLGIVLEYAKLVTWVKPNAHCIYGPGEEGAYDSTPETPAFGYIVYGGGFVEADLEEISIKDGNLGWEPKPEA
jgi:hypothetical protein